MFHIWVNRCNFEQSGCILFERYQSIASANNKWKEMATYFAVLDYGHGGSNPGAVYGGVEKKIVNIMLGESVRRSLKDRAGDARGVWETDLPDPVAHRDS